MDTRTFLKTVLPERGILFAQRIHPRQGKQPATILYPVGDVDDLSDKLLELDATYPTDNVYYAMASYVEVKFKTTNTKDGKEFTYVVGRTQDNALAVKSLWFDLDVGKKDSYETQREAVGGVATYCKAVNLPLPLILSSGYGVHCYWVFTESVDATEWEEIAKYQRAAWRHLKIKVDAACDQDCARVLRAPGCHNKRSGQPQKKVRVLREAVNALPPSEIKRRLRAYVEANALVAQVQPNIPPWALGAGGNLDAALPAYPDSFALIGYELGGDDELLLHSADPDVHTQSVGAVLLSDLLDRVKQRGRQFDRGPDSVLVLDLRRDAMRRLVKPIASRPARREAALVELIFQPAGGDGRGGLRFGDVRVDDFFGVSELQRGLACLGAPLAPGSVDLFEPGTRRRAYFPLVELGLRLAFIVAFVLRPPLVRQ